MTPIAIKPERTLHGVQQGARYPYSGEVLRAVYGASGAASVGGGSAPHQAPPADVDVTYPTVMEGRTLMVGVCGG